MINYKCFICTLDKNCNKVCDCNFGYSHNECLEKWILSSNNFKCTICNKNYNINYLLSIKIQISIIFKELYKFYLFSIQYNLYTGEKWFDE